MTVVDSNLIDNMSGFMIAQLINLAVMVLIFYVFYLVIRVLRFTLLLQKHKCERLGLLKSSQEKNEKVKN